MCVKRKGMKEKAKKEKEEEKEEWDQLVFPPPDCSPTKERKQPGLTVQQHADHEQIYQPPRYLPLPNLLFFPPLNNPP